MKPLSTRLTKRAHKGYTYYMNDYELSKLADMMDEDAVSRADYDLCEQLADYLPLDPKTFKNKYLEFYDDIKTNPYDDW